MECTLSRFVNGTKLCGMVDMLVGRNVIQTDLDHLERWAYVNLLKFNNTKYNPYPSPALDRTILSTNTGWVEKGLRAVLGRKTWGFG